MLKVWLSLTGTLENKGISNVTVTNNGATVNASGKIGSCYSFAKNAYLDINKETMTSFTTAASISFWIKINSWNTNWDTIFQAGKGGTPWNNYIFGILRNQGNFLCFTVTNSSDSSSQGSYVTSNLTVGQWAHIACTYTTGKIVTYLNGIKCNEYTTSIVPNFAGITSIKIGGLASNYKCDCLLNDVRIYDHCLSAAEVHEISQGLVLHYKLDNITNGIQDSSGYGHNGTIINTLSLVTSQARYSSNIHFSANNQHIQLPAITYSNFGNSFTIAWWGKRSTHSNMMFWGFSDGNRLNGMYNGTLWNTGDGSNNPIYKPGTTTTITAPTATSWHHYVMVGNGTKSQLYVDGILYGEAKTYKGLTGTSIWINGWRNHTEYSSTDMDISDFRIYCTALSADDILSLYHTAAKVDNLGGLHTFELNENGSNKLTKTGIFKDYMVEPFMTLADGSKWQLILYHYVDGGNNLFTSSNATFCNDFGLYSRLAYIDNFTYDSKYEFYVLQDDIEYRWTQTSKPTATSISGLTTVSGYTNPVNGLAKPTSLTQTYIGYNSWWGACGCWTSYSTGGKTGIPGFGAHSAAGMCTKYLALYARISEPKFKIANLSVYANNLIER